MAAGRTWAGDPTAGLNRYRDEILPLLKEYCFDCHGDGAAKGHVAFDQFKSAGDTLESHDLWLRTLKNLRSGFMPPEKKPQPDAAARQKIEAWIKEAVFEVDPGNPDPGRVTLRRLNRVEYRNTIRDLVGVDLDTDKELPPDDAGYGFDNIGDALTLPPMLLEKYLALAKTVVLRGVPSAAGVPAEKRIPGTQFIRRPIPAPAGQGGTHAPGSEPKTASTLSYYEEASAAATFHATNGGRFQIVLDFTAAERFVDNEFDYNRSRLVFQVDGEDLHTKEYAREGNRVFRLEFDRELKAGEHTLTLEAHPLTPGQKQVRSLSFKVEAVTVRGPMDPKYWVPPKGYARFFPKPVPAAAEARRGYAREILNRFVNRAYRRAVDASTVDRLVAIAESTFSQPGKSFEEGVGQAIVAVLASPRFLFREEMPEPVVGGAVPGKPVYPWVDETALASRLSYFLWSSTPDDELLRLAKARGLRKDLNGQVARLLKDPKSDSLVRHFVGQWLQVRDIETIQIEARQVLAREAAPDPNLEVRRQRLRELRDKEGKGLAPAEKKEMEELRAALARRAGGPPRAELTGDLRRAMRLETEKAVDFVLREDRSLLELLDCNYTFLNETLAKHYGLTNLNVTGEDMRRVVLPADSPRGGVITHGAVLAVTSNPTRTSPVKRGLFILDNLLGAPPPPPPPDIPPLEDAAKAIKTRTLTLRETLALHREQPQCSSCHNRMDPLGLALEHFNALGMWREQERGLPIDAAGKLHSGESFATVKELKRILAERHAREFYHTLTEKLLTYALGRGLDYYDVATVDGIVDQLQAAQGRPSVLLAGIIQSAPFQKMRAPDPSTADAGLNSGSVLHAASSASP